MNPPCFTPAVPVPNAVEQALMESARCNAAYPGAGSQDETTRRLTWVINATECLTEILAEADLRGFDLRPQSLYGVAALIAQELRVIDGLHDALHATLKTPPAPERQS